MSPVKNAFFNILDKLGLVVMLWLISVSCVFDSPEWRDAGAWSGVGLALAAAVFLVLLVHVWYYRPSGEEVSAEGSGLNHVLIVVEFAAAVAAAWLGLAAVPETASARAYLPAGWALLRLCRVYANCVEVYWDLLWTCPFLTAEGLFLAGLATGRVLEGYGLVSLFWSDGVSWHNSLVVASLSSSMMILTYGVLFLCAHFDVAHRYAAELDGEGGLPPEAQVARRVVDLWSGLLPGYDRDLADPSRRNKYPGNFVWICCRPIIFLMAMPAVFPILAVDPIPTVWARLGWFLGLSLAAFLLRRLFVVRRVVMWVVERTEARRPDGTRHEPAYPTRLNGSALTMIVLPILFILATTHLMNKVAPSATSWTSLVVAGFLGLVCLGRAIVCRWRLTEWGMYCGFWLLVAAPPWCLSVLAALLNSYLAAPFGVCWLLMTLGYVASCLSALVGGQILRKSGLFSRRVVRRGIQVGLVAVGALLLMLNGRSARTGLGERGQAAAKSIAAFEKWYAGYVVSKDKSLPPSKEGFGSKELAAARDHDVLSRWRDGAPARASDEVVPVGFWRRGADGTARWEADAAPKPKLVVVATSGGGLRAAVWSEKVLYELAREIPEFGDRVRLITGSSGGMLGAACFVAGLAPADAPGAPESQAGGVDAVVDRDLHRDFLTPVLQRMIFGDLFSTATNRIPSFGEIEGSRLDNLTKKHVGDVHRGWVLESALASADRGVERLGLTFKEMHDRGEGRGRLPSLVFTPTIVEDSRRMVISNLDLGPLVFNHGAFDALSGRETYDVGPDLPYYSCNGVQFFHLFPGLRDSLDLACAVRMNATFPYVTPAQELRTRRELRVVDAGYYDNYGIELATAWLEQHRRWLELNTSGVVLVQIRAFSNERQLKRLTPLEALREGAGGASDTASDDDFPLNLRNLLRGAEFVTTPLATMGAARSNVNYYRNDSAVENLKRSFTFDVLERLTGVPAGAAIDRLDARERDLLKERFSAANGFFRVITFTCGSPESDDPKLADRETLSWYLAGDEFKKILKNWDTIDNYRRLQSLRGVFRRRFQADDESRAVGAEPPHPFWVDASTKVAAAPEGTDGPATSRTTTHQGKGYTAWRKRDSDREVVWEFKDVPPGRYRIAINLPRRPDARTKSGEEIKDDLADEFVHRVDTPLSTTRHVFKTKPWRENVDPVDLGDANPSLGWRPSDVPGGSPFPRLRDTKDEQSALGHWYRLAPETLDLTKADGPVTVKVALAPGDDDRYVIADAVRLDRE